MPPPRSPLCIEEFAREFESHGIRAKEALSLASKLLMNNPIRSRKALDKLAVDFERRGVEHGEAETLAWSILAYQQIDSGTTFGDLISRLQIEGLSYEQAFEISLSGSKIERRINVLVDDDAEYEEIEIPLGLLFLALTAISGIAMILGSF